MTNNKPARRLLFWRRPAAGFGEQVLRLGIVGVCFAGVSISDAKALSPEGREVRDLLCRNNIRISNVTTIGPVQLGRYTFYEDGATPLRRTGYEVALFRRLKRRLFEGAYPQLDPPQIFRETINAMIDVERPRHPTGPLRFNLQGILLTAHNVTRLLARPEQWSTELTDETGLKMQITAAGQNRATVDPAFPIILDLRGIQSVDNLPPTRVLFPTRTRSLDIRDIYEAFYGPNGVFLFYANSVLQPRAVEERARQGFTAAHWNGGIHYYYFVGALATLAGGQGAAGAASYLESYIKSSMGDPVRSDVQRGVGLYNGALDISRFVSGLYELSDDDLRCGGPAPPPVVLPEPRQTENVQEGYVCWKVTPSYAGGPTCACRDPVTGYVPTGNALMQQCRQRGL